jgi:signal transduction histidine kinase
MSDRNRRGLALALFAILVACEVGYVLASHGLDVPRPGLVEPDPLDLFQLFGSLATGLVGLVLVWSRPRNRVGWLICASGLSLALCNLGQAYGEHAVAFPDEGLPLGVWAMALSAPLWVMALFIPPSLVLVRYPTGILHGRWPRRLELAATVGLVLTYGGYAASPDAVSDELTPAQLAWQHPEWVAGAMVLSGASLLVLATLAIAGDAVWRTLRGPRADRVALLLLLTTTLTTLVLVLFWEGLASGAAYFAILVSLAVGVLRYQALGIDVVVQRAVVYVVLTGLVLVGFVGIVAAVALVVPQSGVPELVAAAVVAVGLAPARQRIQSGIDRLLYGERDPIAAMELLATPLGSDDVDEIVPRVLTGLASSLRLRRLEIDGPGGDVSVPLVFGGVQLGVLQADARSGERTLGSPDRRLLEAVAPLIAAVAYAARVAGELADERERVVQATMSERRRLRGDLHDGLGPSLTGMALGLEAARRDGASDEMLARLHDEVTASLRDVRRIIDDLAPTALDQQDLLAALRRRTDQLSDTGVVEVALDAPGRLPDLSPGVAAAAYRITDEALTNVARHSGATRCQVRVRIDEDLHLEVTDDGVGPGIARDDGIGLASMRERAERLGGTFTFGPSDPGTRVCVRLPLAAT